jgi:hypothetical protein
VSGRSLFASLLRKRRQSDLFRKWLLPDDLVLFQWGDAKQTGRVLAAQRKSLLVDLCHGRSKKSLRIPYDRVVRMVLPRERNQESSTS